MSVVIHVYEIVPEKELTQITNFGTEHVKPLYYKAKLQPDVDKAKTANNRIWLKEILQNHILALYPYMFGDPDMDNMGFLYDSFVGASINMKDFSQNHIDTFDIRYYGYLLSPGEYRKFVKFASDSIINIDFYGHHRLYLPVRNKVKFINLNGEEDHAHRQGFFFKSSWMLGKHTSRLCTSLSQLRRTLDEIITVKHTRQISNKERRYDFEMKRGLEAYQNIIHCYEQLTKENPDKKYFVEISF